MVLDRHTGEWGRLSSLPKIAHHHFYDLPDFLRPGDLLVHNESRVIPARLFARKPTGGKVELLLLRQRTDYAWETLVRGRNVHVGLCLAILDSSNGLPIGAEANVVEEGERGMCVLSFDQPVLSLAAQVGVTPLPPYIHAPLKNGERYQTIYARVPGSAAAPTAGLHFTPALLSRLREMDVRSAFVTLHIGLDTFRPVGEERIEDHRMHTEYGRLTPEVAEQVNQAKREGHRVVAVGTTSVRILETAAGKSQSSKSPFAIRHSPFAIRHSPFAIRHSPFADSPFVQPFEGATDLFIYPGYEYKVVDVLITNFHLPRSTLLMLVAAFAGKELLDRAYHEAIRERYRFYSFGDAMLIV